MEPLQLNPIEQQVAEDLNWVMRAPEVQQHAGKLVAVHKKRVLAVGTDRDALLAKACEKAKCARQDLVVMVVPATDFTGDRRFAEAAWPHLCRSRTAKIMLLGAWRCGRIQPRSFPGYISLPGGSSP